MDCQLSTGLRNETYQALKKLDNGASVFDAIEVQLTEWPYTMSFLKSWNISLIKTSVGKIVAMQHKWLHLREYD